MPPFETMDRHQTAVLWNKVGDDSYGEPLHGDPEEIQVRWTYKRTQIVDAKGNSVGIDAQAVVNQEIIAGSQMYLGSLSFWTGTGSADEDVEVMEVVAYNYTSDIKNRNVRRTVMLRRFRASLPDAG